MTKKGSNSIQKLLMTKREVYRNDGIILTIAGLSLILSSKIRLFATVFKSFQMEIIVKKISILEFGSNPGSTSDYNNWKKNFHLAQATVIYFN